MGKIEHLKDVLSKSIGKCLKIKLTKIDNKISQIDNKISQIEESQSLGVLPDDNTLFRDSTTGKGIVKAIKTANGQTLKFFVGKKADYEALPDTTNVLGLFTDDPLLENINNMVSAIETLTENVESLTEANASLTEDIADLAAADRTIKSDITGIVEGTKPVGKLAAGVTEISHNGSDSISIKLTKNKVYSINARTSEGSYLQGFTIFISSDLIDETKTWDVSNNEIKVIYYAESETLMFTRQDFSAIGVQSLIIREL